MSAANPIPGMPAEAYPQQVLLKVIGRMGILDYPALSEAVAAHLGTQDRSAWRSIEKGEFISHTFLVTVPDGQTEERLRRAIHAIPGVITQL